MRIDINNNNDMDWMSTFIEISAYVIGVAGLCWGIYVYYKQKKYPALLTCDVLESISLSAPEKLGNLKVRIMVGNWIGVGGDDGVWIEDGV